MTRPQSRSFRNRLLLSFLIASLAPMIICSTMLSQISRIQMTKQLDTDAQTQTAHLMTALDRISDALPGKVDRLCHSPFWHTGHAILNLDNCLHFCLILMFPESSQEFGLRAC